MATIYAIHGFIGAGKTTFARKLLLEKKAVLLNHDRWMAHFYGADPDNFPDCFKKITGMILGMASDFLSNEVDVILDWGFWDKTNPDYFGRDQLRDFAKKTGANLVFFHVKCDLALGLDRMLKRSVDEQPLKITREVYFERLKRFVEMTPEEGAIIVGG